MYVRYMIDVCQIYDKCMSDICQMYDRYMTDVCQIYDRCMIDACQLKCHRAGSSRLSYIIGNSQHLHLDCSDPRSELQTGCWCP